MKQTFFMSHAETITQNVLGLLAGFIILKLFGVSSEVSFKIQFTFFVVAYMRSYLVRRFFNRLENK